MGQAVSPAICLLALLVSIPAFAAETGAGKPYAEIAKLASSLSDGEPIGAIEIFDKRTPGYNAIAERIQALATQTEVLCSIDVVGDKEADEAMPSAHHLDLDWFMTLKSRADSALIERRRLRVAVTMELVNHKWRITALSPVAILAPITIR